MGKFVITSDSSCDLLDTTAEALDVKCAFLSYTIGDEMFYDDMVAEHKDEFYDKMYKGAVPKTSQVTPAQFIDFFTPILDEGKPILHLSIASTLSGTLTSANIASAELMGESENADIRVVDTGVGSAGIAMLIYEAVKYRDAGKTIEEAIAHIDAIKGHINVLITTNDLTYMRRGGRISTASAVIGSALSINPIIALSKDSHLFVQGKVRGEKAVKAKFMDMLESSVLKPEKQTLYVAHSRAPERAKEYAEEIQKRFGFKSVEFMQFGTIIGTHAGPGLVSAWYFGKGRKSAVIK